MRFLVSMVLLSQLVLGTNVAWAQSKLPVGWRLPAGVELEAPSDTQVLAKWRSESPERFISVSADFDGDGKKDVAQLLVSADGRRYGLFVLMGDGQRLELDTAGIGALGTIGISEMTPGVYVTGCGKGYWECKAGEPERVKLSQSAIAYFKHGGGMSIFYWSNQTGKFQRVRLSD